MKRALVIIDMQVIFGEPSSQWYVPGYESAAEKIATIANRFDGPIVWTRFVRDPAEEGRWAAYYDRWDQCREAPDSRVWDLTLQPDPSDKLLSTSRFSKWGTELDALTDHAEELVLCGVATDCCVLSTALGAVDAGKSVVLIEDACAGVTPEAHTKALSLLKLLEPMTTTVQSSEVLS